MRAVASARLSTPGGRISSMRLVQSAPGGAVCGGVYVRICADTRETPTATTSASTAIPEQASIAITAGFLTLTAHLPVRKTRGSAEGEKVAEFASIDQATSCCLGRLGPLAEPPIELSLRREVPHRRAPQLRAAMS